MREIWSVIYKSCTHILNPLSLKQKFVVFYVKTRSPSLQKVYKMWHYQNIFWRDQPDITGKCKYFTRW